MSKEEIIDQLESLKSHCEDFADKEDPEDIFNKDVAALLIAIKIMKRAYRSPAK